MIQTLVPYRFTTRFIYYLKHGLSEEQPHQLPPITSRKIISSYVFTQSFSDPNVEKYADEVKEQAVKRKKPLNRKIHRAVPLPALVQMDDNMPRPPTAP